MRRAFVLLAVGAVAAAGCMPFQKTKDLSPPKVMEFPAPPAEARYENPPEEKYRKPPAVKDMASKQGGGGMPMTSGPGNR